MGQTLIFDIELNLAKFSESNRLEGLNSTKLGGISTTLNLDSI